MLNAKEFEFLNTERVLYGTNDKDLDVNEIRAIKYKSRRLYSN